MTHTILTSLTDDRPLARHLFQTNRDTWQWVVGYVTEEFDCPPDDVHCTDDDLVTVAGVPVLRLLTIPN